MVGADLNMSEEQPANPAPTKITAMARCIQLFHVGCGELPQFRILLSIGRVNTLADGNRAEIKRSAQPYEGHPMRASKTASLLNPRLVCHPSGTAHVKDGESGKRIVHVFA